MTQINLQSNMYGEEIKPKTMLYLSWTLMMLFVLTIIVVHSTIYNSVLVSTLSISILGIFLYYNYINLKI